MNTETKIFESRSLIRFPDCDPFNHLNNARYIDYLINAREDHLVKYAGLNIYEMAMRMGKSWVVKSNQIAYLSPAYLMETVTIQSQMLRWGDKEILVEMRMWDEKKTRLKALMWSVFVHYDLKAQKAINHTAEMIEQFSPLVLPVEPMGTFEERVAYVKKSV